MNRALGALCFDAENIPIISSASILWDLADAVSCTSFSVMLTSKHLLYKKVLSLQY